MKINTFFRETTDCGFYLNIFQGRAIFHVLEEKHLRKGTPGINPENLSSRSFIYLLNVLKSAILCRCSHIRVVHRYIFSAGLTLQLLHSMFWLLVYFAEGSVCFNPECL